MGTKRDALRLVRNILQKKGLIRGEFFEVITAIGMFSTFHRWKSQIEAAYDRQSRRFKRQVRVDMLAMYAANEDWDDAFRFVDVRRAKTPAEMLFSMDVLLELGKLDDAAYLAKRCKRVLSYAADPSDQSLLLAALGRFCSRTHRWEDALAVWEHMPLDQAHRRDALSGIVQIHLARALESIERGLHLLSELRKNPNIENRLSLPENDEGLTRDAEKELLKFKRGIEKLLPEKTRKQLGMMCPNESNEYLQQARDSFDSNERNSG
jgi:hypothetical protein